VPDDDDDVAERARKRGLPFCEGEVRGTRLSGLDEDSSLLSRVVRRASEMRKTKLAFKVFKSCRHFMGGTKAGL